MSEMSLGGPTFQLKIPVRAESSGVEKVNGYLAEVGTVEQEPIVVTTVKYDSDLRLHYWDFDHHFDGSRWAQWERTQVFERAVTAAAMPRVVSSEQEATLTVPRRFAIAWTIVSALLLASGVAFGASIFGGVGLDPMNSLFCILASGALAGTLLLAGRSRSKPKG